MLARLAENLFWAGRYLERAEHAARVVDVSHSALLESSIDERDQVMDALLAMLVADEEFTGSERPRDPESIVSFLVGDRGHPASVVSCVGFVRENIRSVRELVSQELWESTNNLYLHLQGRDLEAEVSDRPYEVLASVRQQCQLVSGVIRETLPRDDGFRFLTLGLSLERAASTARTVANSYERLVAGDATDFHVWVATLKSCSALEAYRRIHRASMDPTHVVGFLALSRDFPRSTLFNLRFVEHALGQLAGSADNDVCRKAGRLRSSLEYLDGPELVEQGVAEVLTRAVDGMDEIASLMGPQFFHQGQPGMLQSVRA